MYIVAADATYVLLLMILFALLFGLCVTALAFQALISTMGRTLGAVRVNAAESVAGSAARGFEATPVVPARP